MDSISAVEQNRLLGVLADLLRGREQTQGQLGSTGMGALMDLILPKAETVEKWSYGDPLFRMPQQSNIPITADKGYLADTIASIPTAGGVTNKAANISADKLVQLITRNPIATAPAALEAAGQMSPLARITTYHGSPYLFKQFDQTKVGTGEGAQAYGFGAGYTAGVRDVAESYSPRDSVYEANLMRLYKQAERKQDYNSMEVLESAMMHKRPAQLREQYGQDAENIISQIEKVSPKSYLYKGDIPDELLPKFVDWDAEIKNQSVEVRNLAKKLGLKEDDLGGDLVSLVGKNPDGTKVMEEAGIKGIKYFDANSRNSQYGSQNFIPFRPEDFKIQEINDIPIEEWIRKGLLAP